MDETLHYGDVFNDDRYVRRRFEIYHNFMAGRLTDQATVLDVGGYMGDMLRVLAAHGDQPAAYYVVDADEQALEIAHRRGAIPIRMDFNRDALESTVKAGPFDVVLCAEVLEHLLDPERHLAAIARLLKPDGVCIVSLPNENSVFHRLMSLAGRGVDQCAFELHKHLHLPAIYQSRRFVARHLDIVAERYYINPSLKGSRAQALGRLLTVLPDGFWDRLAQVMPGLFARGVVFKTRLKTGQG